MLNLAIHCGIKRAGELFDERDRLAHIAEHGLLLTVMDKQAIWHKAIQFDMEAGHICDQLIELGISHPVLERIIKTEL